MDAGAGRDAQYLSTEDILGTNRSHMPRQSKVYRNFAAEYDRLRNERIAAFNEYVADVESGAYREEKHIVRVAPPDELKTDGAFGILLKHCHGHKAASPAVRNRRVPKLNLFRSCVTLIGC